MNILPNHSDPACKNGVWRWAFVCGFALCSFCVQGCESCLENRFPNSTSQRAVHCVEKIGCQPAERSESRRTGPTPLHDDRFQSDAVKNQNNDLTSICPLTSFLLEFLVGSSALHGVLVLQVFDREVAAKQGRSQANARLMRRWSEGGRRERDRGEKGGVGSDRDERDPSKRGRPRT